MKGLTVRQPHARLIEIREKTIELRSWTTRYRGDLLICAAARADFELAYPTGCTICLVRLADVRPFFPADSGPARSRWRTGLYAWILEDVRAVPKLPLKGALGLFAVPPEVENAVRSTTLPPLGAGQLHRGERKIA